MRRREFIAGLGGAAAWPLRARGQQSAMPVIGFLQGRSAETAVTLAAAFRQGLHKIGFDEARNVAIEYRYANGRFDRLPALAAELVRRRVDVIAAGYPSGQAAKAATETIPIVFVGGSDPVRAGLVASINRPGGNVTGVSLFAADLETKRVGLLHELVPQATVIGALIDANDAQAAFQLQEVKKAASLLGLSTAVVNVRSERDFDDAFAALVRDRAGALIVAASTFFNVHRDRLIGLSAQHHIPTVYELREFAEHGGLMTYAPSIDDVFRQAGVYTGRLLKGERPAELPVLLPAQFELVINVKAAKALGLTIPETLLATADEVIQ